MSEMQHAPWPEVEPPRGWKKNPRIGQRLSWILILTVIVAGGVTVLSAGRSEVLPAVCFVALVALPFVGPAVSRLGMGGGDWQAQEVHAVTSRELTTDGAGRMVRCRAAHQKLSLPDEMDGATLTQAAPGLFAGNRSLAFVHLPGMLEAIPERMFSGCDNLPAIVIPPQVKRIGSRAFYGCTELKDVYLPASVEEIAPDAFEGCGNVLMHVRPGSRAEEIARGMGFVCANR